MIRSQGEAVKESVDKHRNQESEGAVAAEEGGDSCVSGEDVVNDVGAFDAGEALVESLEGEG
jgi:hypothetical protein